MVVRVVQVSNPVYEPTRIFLPKSEWGNMIMERLSHLGWVVEILDQDPESTVRSDKELLRRDLILEQVDIE